MIGITTLLAIVVSPPVIAPPPTPPAPMSECKYSAMINTDSQRPVYKCYSESEWQQKQANDAKANQQQAAAVSAWVGKHWWLIILGGILFFFLLFVLFVP